MSKFILLLPLEPSMFGLDNDDLTAMVTELAEYSISALLVPAGDNYNLFAQSTDIKRLNDLCTSYNLPGVVVESIDIYDQSITEEAVIG